MHTRRTPQRPLHLNDISGEIADSAVRVHSALGPGLNVGYRIDLLIRDAVIAELKAVRKMANRL